MTVRTAWTLVLRTTEGRIALADILHRAYHNDVTEDPERRVLQQFAAQTLHMAGLFEKGSFPIEYVNQLTGTKLKHPIGWFGRLLARMKKNV